MPELSQMKNGLLIGLSLIGAYGAGAGSDEVYNRIYGSQRVGGHIIAEQGYTGTGYITQIRSSRGGGTGFTVIGITTLSTEGSATGSNGCESTMGSVSNTTCFVNTGSLLHPNFSKSSTASGVQITDIFVMGNDTPGGAVSLDCDLLRNASGSTSGSSLLNNVSVSTGSLFHKAFSGSSLSLAMWDRYQSFKCSSLTAAHSGATFRVVIKWIEDFDD